MLSDASPQRDSTSTTWEGETPKNSYLGLIQGDLLDGIEDGGRFVDKLEKVFVRRDDDGQEFLGRRLPGQAAQDVVRLVLFIDKDWNPQSADDLFELRDLFDQVLGHRLAVSFIVLIDFVPKLGAGGVKHNPEIFRLLPVHYLTQRADKPKNGIRRESLGGRKALDGVIRPVEQRVSIDEIDFFLAHGEFHYELLYGE